MLLTAILEMVSIGLILPLIHTLFASGSGVTARFFEYLLPNVPTHERLVWVTSLFVAALLMKNAALLAMIHLINRVIHVKQADFAQRMFRIYLARPLLFHLGRNSAEILRNVTTGGNRAFEAIRVSLMLLLDVLLVAVTVGLLFFVQPVVTLGASVILVIVAGSYYVISSPMFARWGVHLQHLDGAITKCVNQALGGIREVKMHHSERFLTESFGTLAQDKSRLLSLAATAQHVPRLAVESLAIIGFMAAVLTLLATTQPVEDILSTLGLFGMAGLRLMPSVNRIMYGASDLRHRTAFVDTLHQDLIEGQPDADKALSAWTGEKIRFERSLDIEGVTVQYPGQTSPALIDVSLSIRKGEAIGIIGPSGAGKTSLTDVIMGLIAPQTGTARIDGVDVVQTPDAWQRCIGYVPQQVYLSDDTIRRNIAFGRADAEIDDAAVHAALHLAQLSEMVRELPAGLDTVVGERGARLSGGQQQRIGIARALYNQPDVLVLDEATAALDSRTEADISSMLKDLRGAATLLIIAHRLSTVRGCDRLILLDRGRIVDVGTFEALMQRQPLFRELVQLAQVAPANSGSASQAR
jgi:ATP-binding cassette subfamily C protein